MSEVQTGDIGRQPLSVKRIAYISIFIALSAVGAMIKIPSPVGTIGFDAAPGYFAALALGRIEGMAVISIGHMLTGGIVGFPLGLPLHIFIAIQMAAWAFILRFVSQKFGLIAGSVVTIFFNGVVASFSMYFMGGMGAVIGIMPFLVVGSAANVILAVIAYKAVKAGKLL